MTSILNAASAVVSVGGAAVSIGATTIAAGLTVVNLTITGINLTAQAIRLTWDATKMTFKIVCIAKEALEFFGGILAKALISQRKELDIQADALLRPKEIRSSEGDEEDFSDWVFVESLEADLNNILQRIGLNENHPTVNIYINTQQRV